eukprot:scaffold56325_cov53-Phaeocystis_antarctica.AAC.1
MLVWSAHCGWLGKARLGRRREPGSAARCVGGLGQGANSTSSGHTILANVHCGHSYAKHHVN